MRFTSGNGMMRLAVVAALLVAILLICGTIWTGHSASRATEEAVRSVSMFYLEELAGRREQVISSSLSSHISNMQVAIGLLKDEDLEDMEHLQDFQARMKKLYGLEKFAFVDSDGLIYTALGTQTDIDSYPFDYRTLEEPLIEVKDPGSQQKQVIIAVPTDGISFLQKELCVCFMEIEMSRMLEGISLQSENNETTFCNIYTPDGLSLTNMILGGLASEDNLLSAMRNADIERGYSLDQMISDFKNGRESVISFTYNGIRETMYYEPVTGTNWMLTYLIRESLITDRISAVTRGIVLRSTLQTLLTAAVLAGIAFVMVRQTRRNAGLLLEKEMQEAESRVKQQELEERLVLQGKLLEEERQRVQQDSMITALASDYRSVYYVNLDTDEGICYRADTSKADSLSQGEHFSYHKAFTDYANRCVAERNREEFLRFIEPDRIRAALAQETILTLRYLVTHGGKESYEMLRMAGVRHAEDRTDHIVHAIGVGFTNVDRETRDALAKSEALRDALTAAEDASRAKTAFLSNMSHEIRTPMNAIIGLDAIALADPDISEKTREYLEKIGSSAQHLLTLINDILDMSRIESGRMTIKNEDFSFAELLEQINTMLSGQCEEKGLQYNCRIIGQVDSRYIGDNVKLRQVLINILGNAVKFTHEGGVDLTVERTAHFDRKSTLRFVIRDTGIGMSQDYLPHLFDAFSQEDSSATSRYGSSGLGMAITKSIVEMMNGNITVESEKGKGTVFTVTVTLMDSDQDEAVQEEIRPQDLAVLIVDDDPVACEHARLVLEKIGIASESADSGEKAIEMVRLRHARRNPYNLLLIDWKMPGMDGVETTRRIRSIIGTESAIIILTAYKWDDIQEEAVSAGVDSFLPKPLFASNVLEEFRSTQRKRNLLATKKQNRAELAGRRILLAEDVEVNAEIIMMVLSMREIQAEHAENGRVAVEMFEKSPEGYYDAILMDMRMPEMDGLTATTRIRALPRADAAKIPIIALTANAFDEDVQRSLQAGLNAHLSKPVDPENLFETLESLIPA